jgi:hypothetical protein
MARYPEQLIKSAFLSLDLHLYRSTPISFVICYFHTELKYGFYVRNLNMSAKSPTLRSVALLATADLPTQFFTKCGFVYDDSHTKHDMPLPVT